MEKNKAAGPTPVVLPPTNAFSLSLWPAPLKVLATCLILTLLTGYGVSLLQVFDRSHFDMMKTILYYRGDGSIGDEAIMLPQNYRTMLSIAHVHTLSQPFMFAFFGLIFAFSRVPNRAKSFFIIMSFAGSLVSNATPWLLRYVSPKMVWLFPLSQLAIFFSIVVMATVSLWELWFKHSDITPPL
ncbi:MAG: hypothetical protein HY541_06415, partial [Deltaproteobacteria bacterium]|nr:hypothetical protein [Deltaproteobacteria bacterium]